MHRKVTPVWRVKHLDRCTTYGVRTYSYGACKRKASSASASGSSEGGEAQGALPDGTRPIELAPASRPETVLVRNTEGSMVVLCGLTKMVRNVLRVSQE